MFGKFSWNEIARETIKKRAKIVVIDDDEFPYLTLFTRDEYGIEKWDDVKDLEKLESGYFDVIFLDIQGVGTELSSEEGLGILKHIKEYNPAQIVIAYSNADWSLKYQRFFELADEKIAKSSDYTDFKRILDNQLHRRFSYHFYEDHMLSILDGKFPQGIAISKFKKSIVKNNENFFKKLIVKYKLNEDNAKTVLRILGTAIEIYSVISGMQ